MSRRSWEPREIVRLKQMIRDKVSFAIIGLDLNRDELSVSMKASHLGLKRPDAI